MSIVNFDIFFNFYLENKEKLFMESGAKGVNIANIQKWFTNIQTYSPEEIKETYKFFARTFTEFLVYVPFDDFYKIINLMSLQFEQIINSPDYTNIYFFIPDTINKSNMWVTLLFLDCLVKNNLLTPEIQAKIKIVNMYHKLVEDSNNSKSLCIYCDDMSYTGTQISSNFNNRLINNKSTLDTNIDKYFIISYISNIGKDKITKEVKNAFFCDNTIAVYSYVDQLQVKYNDGNEEMVNNVLKMFSFQPDNEFMNMGHAACQCSKKYIPIYFDHKIADNLSTFNKLLFTGAYPTKGNVCEINPLIEGCNNIANLKELFGENPCVRTQTVDSEIPCFPAFYKTIPYVLDGNIVLNADRKNILNLFIETSSIKGGRQNKSQRKNKQIKKHTNKRRLCK